MGRHVALLRADNVGGRRLPVAELRALCDGLGWRDVVTYIQSGNLLFTGNGSRAALEAALEAAIAERFAMAVPTIVRSAAEWSRLAETKPFPEVPETEFNRVMLLVSKRPPAADAEQAIGAKAAAGERVQRAGDALWIHFPDGAGRSKLTPSSIDRAIGSPATARNHRTVLKLAEMLR